MYISAASRRSLSCHTAAYKPIQRHVEYKGSDGIGGAVADAEGALGVSGEMPIPANTGTKMKDMKVHLAVADTIIRLAKAVKRMNNIRIQMLLKRTEESKSAPMMAMHLSGAGVFEARKHLCGKESYHEVHSQQLHGLCQAFYHIAVGAITARSEAIYHPVNPMPKDIRGKGCRR